MLLRCLMPCIVLIAALLPLPALAQTVLDHDYRPLAGRQPVNLATAYGGKVVLVVNTASKCGYTQQYEGLEALHARYGTRGLAVLGFPSNDFLGQEPGSEEEIPCQLLLIAAGFIGCERYVAEAFGLERDGRGNLITTDYRVGQSKIFAAGDCRRGQSLVVWGITEGRACAKAVDEFLMGYTNML